VKAQYNFVRDARGILLEYCERISESDLVQENSDFGRRSIRNLLVHIANIYEYWIGKQGLKKDLPFTSYDSQMNINDLVDLFLQVDALMGEFFKFIEQNRIEKITYHRNGNTEKVTPLMLFTHVITHEFHHKGQILSLSRHLGYLPVDTDIIR
jgi:uncharacterized damage-inducible protein DinB